MEQRFSLSAFDGWPQFLPAPFNNSRVWNHFVITHKLLKLPDAAGCMQLAPQLSSLGPVRIARLRERPTSPSLHGGGVRGAGGIGRVAQAKKVAPNVPES